MFAPRHIVFAIYCAVVKYSNIQQLRIYHMTKPNTIEEKFNRHTYGFPRQICVGGIHVIHNYVCTSPYGFAVYGAVVPYYNIRTLKIYTMTKLTTIKIRIYPTYRWRSRQFCAGGRHVHHYQPHL
jgi:hypothetical protein